MIVHPSITQDLLADAISNDSSVGFCIACGEEASGVEPDARKYDCDSCGEAAVYGAEELLLMVY